MIAIVCGGREWLMKKDANGNKLLDSRKVKWMEGVLDAEPIKGIIVGSTKKEYPFGVDGQAHEWADFRGIPCPVLQAPWRKYGKPAGPIRNCWMMSYGVTDVIAFPGNAGTDNMIKQATAAGLAVRTFQYDEGSSNSGVSSVHPRHHRTPW